ncbi:MAG: 5-formyltetrahydrofolate cyclo-ligase [Rubrivivax sp.]|nr:5-formyltetrahydrofolate cyclo-ligase [Rubrivivax sp.]
MSVSVSVMSRAEIMQWRKAERARLVAARLALPADERRRRTNAIAIHLSETLGSLRGLTVGVYWAFRGEPNLRAWMAEIHAGGAQCALPVVVQRQAPLVFRRWSPGAAMAAGVWKIPVPADDVEVQPDIVVSPVVGFDAAGYRLGYGGGFYDRTLAARARRPLAVGVGFTLAELATIHPLPHDIPMQYIVTEAGRWCAPLPAG